MSIGGIGGGISASLGGLQDAGRRLNESAQRVAGASLHRGQTEDEAAESVQAFKASDIDLAQEAVNQKIASYDYKANLKALQVQDQMQRQVIDILA